MTDPENIFDLQAALDRLGGDRTLFRDLVQFFLEDTPGLFVQVTEGVLAADASVVERAAHSLKGLALNFGAARASQVAFRLEQVGRSGDLAGTPDLLVQLEQELAILTRALMPYLTEPENGSPD